jgi:MFS family permease
VPLSALELPNIRHFVRFRIFFHARYYYPIFAILFLDYGLTLEQFTVLNIIWALTIVVAEVPSGALADLLGRRALLIAGAVLMVIEMGVLLLAPVGGGTLTFALFAINRVCSGLAEAMVSGADEALAFDTLKQEGDPGEWTALLEFLGKRISLVMGLVMVIGASVYDPRVVGSALGWLGLAWEAEWLLRVPIALTFGHSFVVLYSALAMREPGPEKPSAARPLRRLGESFVRVWEAARWLGSHRFVLFVILGGLALDSVARQFVILNSEYYRLIRLPEFAFGFLSAGLAACGFLFARINRHLADHRSPLANLLLLAVVLVGGLVGASYLVPYAGLLFVPAIFFIFSSVSFLQSHYLNREVDSRMRATLLSFRGLALNLGLALASQCYAVLVVRLKKAHPGLDDAARQDAVFGEALAFFPAYAWILLLLLLFGGRLLIRRRGLAIALRP